jgi:hypothetical protein
VDLSTWWGFWVLFMLDFIQCNVVYVQIVFMSGQVQCTSQNMNAGGWSGIFATRRPRMGLETVRLNFLGCKVQKDGQSPNKADSTRIDKLHTLELKTGFEAVTAAVHCVPAALLEWL